MQHVVDFIATMVVASSAAALAQFGVTLKDSGDCPYARAHASPVVQRLPGAVRGQVRPSPAAERRPARVVIRLTLA